MSTFIFKIKKNIRNNKILLSNFTYLSFLNVFNLIFPLLTYPYLIRVLGKESYGLVLFAQSNIAYLIIIISFGFNISATKDISLYRNNKNKLSEIVSSVLLIKVILFFISLISILFIFYIFPKYYEYRLLYLFTFISCLGEVLFPIWYFQGIENMKFITLIQFISKLFFTILIFFIIKSKQDYIWVPFLLGIGSVIGGLIAIFIVFFMHKIKFYFVKPKIIYKYLKEGFTLFISRFSALVTDKANYIFVGTFLGMTEVAYYDLIEKIVTIMKMPNGIINTTIYPRIVATKSKEFVKKNLKIQFLIAIFILIFGFFSGKLIIKTLGGVDMLEALKYLYLYSTVIIITSVSYFLGISVLVSFDRTREFNLSVIYQVLFYLILISVLIFFDMVNLWSLVIVLIISEMFCVFFRLYYVKKFSIL